jgi:sensor domain CHASE-containing protein
MRLILILVLLLGALWVADKFLYHGHYSQEVWQDVKQESQKIESDIRRWTKF